MLAQRSSSCAGALVARRQRRNLAANCQEMSPTHDGEVDMRVLHILFALGLIACREALAPVVKQAAHSPSRPPVALLGTWVRTFSSDAPTCAAWA